MKPLLPDTALWNSSIVSNSTMNRERGLEGVNSYARELRLHPVEFLESVLAASETASWLDLCCGSGKAILEAASRIKEKGLSNRARLHGVDLVPMFYPLSPELSFVQLEQGALPGWEPQQTFDLITCVHGLHYVGDKLKLIQEVSSWLKPDGRFTAHFDPASVQVDAEPAPSRNLMKLLRASGFQYHSRMNLLTGIGPKQPLFSYRYVGADDEAGPNYTGQPAVTSYYETP